MHWSRSSRRFEQREGVEVTTVYNGCGILTGQMRVAAGEARKPGFPTRTWPATCTIWRRCRDWFQEAVNVSDTDIVIAVQKGNPKGIQTLQGSRATRRSAWRSGSRSNARSACSTRRLLEHEGLYDQLLTDNVVTQTATSAMLVPAVTSKSADAALSYRTDTLAERDKLDVVTVESELAKAIQPYSIARSSVTRKWVGGSFRPSRNHVRRSKPPVSIGA